MRKIISHFKENWIRYGFETFVIIIGILGAFFLNNWNENRKARTIEKQTLNEIILALANDSTFLSWDRALHDQGFESCEIILNAFSSDRAYNDTLARHFGASNNYSTFASSRGPYESLKSLGLETITNDSLRNKIINLYDRQFELLEKHELKVTDYIHHLKEEFYPEYFNQFQVIVDDPPGFNGRMTPTNFEKLKENEDYSYHVKTLSMNHKTFSILIGWRINDIRDIINMCHQEVNRLE